MKITLELPDNMIGAFLDGVCMEPDALHLISCQLGSTDLVDGNTVKLPRDKMEGRGMNERRCDNCKYYLAMRTNGERCRCNRFNEWVLWCDRCEEHEWKLVWKE